MSEQQSHLANLLQQRQNLINEIIETLNWTIVFIIIGGGIYLTIISRANPLFRIISGFKLMLKK